MSDQASAREEPTRKPFRRGAGYWATAVLGAVMVIIGLVLAGGGAWLIALGGSWYYLPAGIGLIISGALLIAGSLAGVWVYLIVYLLTLAWAYWEAGFDWWAQVPRVVAPTVFLVLVLLCIPALGNRSTPRRRHERSSAMVMAVLVLGTAVGLQIQSYDGASAQQEAQQQQRQQQQPQQQQPPGQETQPTPPAQGQQAPQQGQQQQDQQQQPQSQQQAAPDQGRAEGADRPAMAMLETGENWPAYGGTYHGTHFSPLNQVNRDNVDQLQRVWTYRTRDLPETQPQSSGEETEPDYAAETTPLVVDGTMYLCSAMNIMIAVDAVTGREKWRYDPGVSTDAIPYSASCRGVAYYAMPDRRTSEHCATRIIEGTLDGRLIAVDARTGQPCRDFGVDGQVNLLDGIGWSVPGFFSVTAPPTIVRGVAVIGHQVNDNQRRDAPSGVIRGYDAVTGELLWAWDMVNPDLDGLPPEGETYARGTPNMWTSAAGDDELGLVYLPMGNAAVDYYGALRREAENRFATSVVALDVTTGEVAWHFQTVHYDVWDYDLGSQPALVDFPTENGTVPAMVLSSKQGDIYVLNRETGESLFPVEEREVPQGGVEPENLSPTQPFSDYHSLAKPDLTERDMWGMSPIDQMWCRIQFRRAHYEGIYTPPSTDRHWIQYPGYNGGSDWGGVAVDQQRGVLIANYNDMPNHNRLVPREQMDELGVMPIDQRVGEDPDAPNDFSPMAGAPYGIDVNAGWRVPLTGLLCKEPPYGGIRAIDLASGETLWDQPLGSARRNGPFGIPSFLPFTIGTPNNGGPVVTASGLIFVAATTDDLIRAIDIETGEVLWQDTLPAGGQATPIVYSVNGRQYLTLMAGGHHFMETPIGDYVITWTLPGQPTEEA